MVVEYVDRNMEGKECWFWLESVEGYEGGVEVEKRVWERKRNR